MEEGRTLRQLTTVEVKELVREILNDAVPLSESSYSRMRVSLDFLMVHDAALRTIIFDHETGFHAAETHIKLLEAQLAQAQARIAELEQRWHRAATHDADIEGP